MKISIPEDMLQTYEYQHNIPPIDKSQCHFKTDKNIRTNFNSVIQAIR